MQAYCDRQVNEVFTEQSAAWPSYQVARSVVFATEMIARLIVQPSPKAHSLKCDLTCKLPYAVKYYEL